MRYLGLLLSVLAFPAFGANVTATTGWTTKADSLALSGTVTVDAGADWYFIFYIDREALVSWSGIPDCTLDTVQPTVEFEFDGGGVQRHHHVVWGWNAAAIATFNDGTPDVGTCNESTADISYLYGAVENTSTTTITAHTGTVDDAAADPSVTTTSSSGDLIICSAIDEDHTTTYTGWDTLTELVDAAVDSTRHGFGAGNGGDTPTVIDIAAPTAASAACLVLADDAAALEFSAGPTRAAATDGHTITGTLNNISGTATVYVAAYLPAASAPADCDAVQTATGALYTATDATWAEDVSDSVTASESGNVPVQDVYVCAEDTGANQTAVTTFDNVARSAQSGFQIDVLTTLSATAIVATPSDVACDTDGSTAVMTGCADLSDFSADTLVTASAGFAETGSLVALSKTATTVTADVASNSMQTNITLQGFKNEDGTDYFSATLATGDVAECSTLADVNNTGTYDDGSVAMAADFDMVYTPDAGEENDFAVVRCYFEDVSDATDGLFTQPNTPNGSPFYIYYNNVVPACNLDSIGGIAYYGAFTSVDLDDLCAHSLGLSMTHELRTGDTMHSGLSLNESTGVISGTVSTENESGLTVQFVTCAGGKCTVSDWLAYFVNTWTVPNCVGSSLATCLSSIESAAPWRAGGDPIATPGCNPSGNVATQNPAASAEAGAYDTITLTLASGTTCSIVGRRGAQVRGVSIGL